MVTLPLLWKNAMINHGFDNNGQNYCSNININVRVYFAAPEMTRGL